MKRPADKRLSRGPWVNRISTPTIDFLVEAGLSANHRWLLIVLADFARNSPFCLPSNRKLAMRMGVKPRRIRSLLADLEHRGFIRRRESSDRHRESIELLYRLDGEAADPRITRRSSELPVLQALPSRSLRPYSPGPSGPPE
jgi:DNA-binding MarR family transcriptional regulator